MHARRLTLLAFCAAIPQLLAAPQPRNLSEAHRDLEQFLTPAGIERVRKARSEDDMLGIVGLPEAVALTNRWHLWNHPPLARYFKSIGVTEPHDMVGIVSATYWCKLHGKPFRLRERATRLQRIYREEDAKARAR
jgi:hypothetical protein